MPAVATDLLDAVAATLTALYPTAKVEIRRNLPPNQSAFAPGDKTRNSFVIYADEAEEGEPIGSLRTLVRYRVSVLYFAGTSIKQRADDGDPGEVRTTRQTVRRRFDKPDPFGGSPQVNDCNPQPGRPYGVFEKSAGTLYSVIDLVFEVVEPLN